MNLPNIEKLNEIAQVVKPRKIIKEVKAVTDESYAKVNQISFQQNFKTLIGHFKKEVSHTTVFNIR